jgi:hypothetical protein
VRTLVDQLREAFEQSELSVPELLVRAKLKLDRSSLHRKLSGELDLKTGEAEALALALDAELVWNPRRRKPARRAA